MSAARFRPPKIWTPAHRTDSVNRLWPEVPPVLRVSRTGIRNMPRKKQDALRKERAADPAGEGVHSWRRRQW